MPKTGGQRCTHQSLGGIALKSSPDARRCEGYGTKDRAKDEHGGCDDDGDDDDGDDVQMYVMMRAR